MDIDQVSSLFRSAWKPDYCYAPPVLKHIGVLTDLEVTEARELQQQIAQWLNVKDTDVQWQLWSRDELPAPERLQAALQDQPLDLVVTYRHLGTTAKDLPYSLGVYADTLTQIHTSPVLLLPYVWRQSAPSPIQRVMAMTDHLAEEHRLIDYGVALTPAEGSLFLAHIEPLKVFKRYIRTISKIPELNTEVAETKIANQLLKEPREFIAACVQALSDTSIHLEPVVTFGQTLQTHRELIHKHDIDLLVLNTKDEEQLAMQGEAYALAVELTQLPLLLL